MDRREKNRELVKERKKKQKYRKLREKKWEQIQDRVCMMMLLLEAKSILNLK